MCLFPATPETQELTFKLLLSKTTKELELEVYIFLKTFAEQY